MCSQLSFYLQYIYTESGFSCNKSIRSVEFLTFCCSAFLNTCFDLFCCSYFSFGGHDCSSWFCHGSSSIRPRHVLRLMSRNRPRLLYRQFNQPGQLSSKQTSNQATHGYFCTHEFVFYLASCSPHVLTAQARWTRPNNMWLKCLINTSSTHCQQILNIISFPKVAGTAGQYRPVVW